MDRHHKASRPAEVFNLPAFHLSLECLAEGDAEPIVVIVDFLAPVKRLGELLVEYSRDQVIYQIDPVADLEICACYLTLEQLAAGYSGALLANLDDRPVIIVGYCSAAALALLIAGALATTRDISLVLVSPQLPDIDMVAAELLRCRTSLGAAGDRIPKFDTADPKIILSDMMEILDQDLRSMVAAKGLDHATDFLSELLRRYQAWLGFLLASREYFVEPALRRFPIRLILAAEEDPAADLASACSAVTRLRVPVDELTCSKTLATEILTHRA